MDSYTHKTLITQPHDLAYSYYLSPNFHATRDPSIPTLLFVHGFPDDAWMWKGVISALPNLPNPIIVLDILGMGKSSKPVEAIPYNYLPQANSIAQILDHEHVPNNVIPIGHDWGSAVSQRFYLYHRTRCVGLSLISVAYTVPRAEPFSLDGANAALTQRFGYPPLEYWNFFTAPDAPAILQAHPERLFEINNGVHPSPDPAEAGRDVWMRDMFCVPGAMRAYATQTDPYANFTIPLKPYAQDEAFRAQYCARLAQDGLEGAVNYYHTLKNNTMLEDERLLVPKAEGGKAADDAEDPRRIGVPVLYIGQTGDWVCRPDMMKPPVQRGFVQDLREHVLEAGHWVMYEKPDEVAALLKAWLSERFPVS